MCLFLWQACIHPVMGLGSETINNANNNGLNSNSVATTKVVIQRGETLWSLAQRYQTTVDELVKLNQVKRPDLIREGQSLWVPKGETETKKKSVELGTKDVKTDSEEISTTSTQVKVAEKATYTWWSSFLRIIPAFAPVYKQGDTIADSQDLPPVLTASMIPTHEIFVGQDPKLSDKVLSSSLPDTSKDSQKPETQKLEAPKTLPASSSQSQVHSRGLGRLVSEEEIELLSRVIYGEARGEDFLGQVAVGAVVLNRVNDSRFPKTIRGVIYESGAFTAVSDRQIHLEPDDQAYKAAEAALSGLDPTNGAIFYYNPRTATDQWIKSRTVIKKIGNHTFSI